MFFLFIRYCVIAAMLIFSPPAMTAGAGAPTLAEAVGAALDRDARQRQLEAARLGLQAEQRIARHWLIEPAAISLSHKDDRWTDDSGVRESELGVELPLWRPGQRRAFGQRAQLGEARLNFELERQRLQMALQVINRAVDVHLADITRQQAQGRSELLSRLTDDVERRVRAGDLADVDAMAARAEWLGSVAVLLAAEQSLDVQLSEWRLLTGLHQVVSLPVHTSLLSAADMTLHPESRLAQAQVQWAEAELGWLRQSNGQPPELSLGLVRDRDEHGAAGNDSLALGFRLPLGRSLEARPESLEAEMALAIARTKQQQTLVRLESHLQLATLEFERSKSQTGQLEQRRALLSQRAALLEKSFHAGETALPEWLRALAQSDEAETLYQQQIVKQTQARLRLLNAQGIMP